jgi:hypothetical protein
LAAYGEPVAQDSAQQAPTTPATPARALLPLILPPLVVGVLASLLLLGVSGPAERLQDVLWKDLPDALGVGRYSVLWMLVMLTATGVLVGSVVWKVRGDSRRPDDHSDGPTWPAWLLVTGRPQMQVHDDGTPVR